MKKQAANDVLNSPADANGVMAYKGPRLQLSREDKLFFIRALAKQAAWEDHCESIRGKS